MKDPIVPIFLSLEEKLNLKRAGFQIQEQRTRKTGFDE